MDYQIARDTMFVSTSPLSIDDSSRRFTRIFATIDSRTDSKQIVELVGFDFSRGHCIVTRRNEDLSAVAFFFGPRLIAASYIAPAAYPRHTKVNY